MSQSVSCRPDGASGSAAVSFDAATQQREPGCALPWTEYVYGNAT